MSKHTKQVTTEALTLSSISDLLDRKLDQKLDERFGKFEITLDKKFQFIDQRFQQIDTRFEQVDQRFEQIDRRFEQVDQRFEQMDQRFEQMDQRFEQMDQRFETIEGKLDQTIETVSDLKEDMDIVKEFLTTQVMTKAEGREIMSIVNRHTREIKELQVIANY